MEQTDATGPVAVRQGPKTWVVVALTLGAVFLAGLLFLAGLVTGVTISDTVPAASPGSAAPAPDGNDDSGTSGGGGGGSVADGSLDECLVGTWRTTEHSESADTDQGRVTITDVDRTLEITEDGTETVTYGSSPARVSLTQGSGQAVYDGTVVYQVSTSGDTMSFQLESAEGTVTISAGGQEQQEELQPGTGDVTYTCSDDEFVQEAQGYRSVMERVS